MDEHEFTKWGNSVGVIQFDRERGDAYKSNTRKGTWANISRNQHFNLKQIHSVTQKLCPIKVAKMWMQKASQIRKIAGAVQIEGYKLE